MNDEPVRVDHERSAAFRIAERIADLLGEDDPKRLNAILDIVSEELANG